MTRRERHLRIIRSWSRDMIEWHMDRMVARRDLDVLKDDAVEELACRLIKARRYTNELNARNRAMRQASEAKP